MRVRPVRETDKPEWLRMRAALWPHVPAGEHDAEMDEDLAGPEGVAVFVCERPGGGLQGFIEASIRDYAEGCESDRVGYIEGWYVDADARRRGVGRALVEAAEQWAIEQGCTEMASDTEIHNELSQRAHGRLGYQEVERIVCFAKRLRG